MNTTTPRRRGRPPGSKNKPKSPQPSLPPPTTTRVWSADASKAKQATYNKRLIALQKARAARAAKRQAAGIVSKPRTTAAASTDQPTSGPAPYLLSDDYRLLAADHRNWILQKLRGGDGEQVTGEDGEDEGEEGATGSWFTVGYFNTVLGACRDFAQRSAREDHGTPLPAAIAKACSRLEKLLQDIQDVTKSL